MKHYVKNLFSVMLILLAFTSAGCFSEGKKKAAGDTTPPIVVSTSPADGASDVALNGPVGITFSEAMNTATLTAQAAAGTCSGSIQVSADSFATCLGGTINTGANPVIVWTPAVNLWVSQAYQVRVTTDVQDSAGNALAAVDSRSFTTRDVTSWAFVDGNGANGINKNTSMAATYPKPAIFNGKFYMTWAESNGTTDQVRVVVYNGDDSNPGWAFVDGNGTVGINKNPGKLALIPRLGVLNNKLYLNWIEAYGTPNRSQVRAAVYNGDDSNPTWTFVDGNNATGINYDITKTAGRNHLRVNNNKFYAAWDEMNATAAQIRVTVYNGNDSSPLWSFVDGNGTDGINMNKTSGAYAPFLAFVNNKLYAAWYENYTVGIPQIRAAVYNGNDTSPGWTFVDGNGVNGLNKDITQSAQVGIPMSFNNKLYLSWYENNASLISQVRAAVYNGNDAAPAWTFIDGNGANGLNKDTSKNTYTAALLTMNSKLYLIWKEDNGAAIQVRVAVYNGNDSAPSFTFVDGNGVNGINKDSTKSSSANLGGSLLYNFNGKVYALWSELNASGIAQIRVAVGQ